MYNASVLAIAYSWGDVFSWQSIVTAVVAGLFFLAAALCLSYALLSPRKSNRRSTFIVTTFILSILCAFAICWFIAVGTDHAKEVAARQALQSSGMSLVFHDEEHEVVTTRPQTKCQLAINYGDKWKFVDNRFDKHHYTTAGILREIAKRCPVPSG